MGKWEKVKLEELTKIKTGKLDANASDKNGKYPFFTCAINPLRIDSYSYDCECVLVAGNGDLNVKYYQGKFDAYQRTYIIESLSSDKLYLPYLFRFLQKYITVLRTKTSGGVIQYIRLNSLTDTKLPLPPLEEQKRIAKNLDLASEIVKDYKEQLAELDKLVQSVFNEMFGDPSKNEKGLPLVRLCDCLYSIENGKSIICNSVPRFGNNPAILKLSAVTNGFYCESENKAMIENNGFVESVEVKKGDLLFTRKNTPELVGMSAYVYNTASKLMMPDLIFRLNTNGSCNKIFLWKLINHDLFRCKIMSLASGSAKSMSNISKARLNQLLIPLPPRKIQNHFAEIVTEIESQKTQVQQALTEAENLFSSLMQEYFE